MRIFNRNLHIMFGFSRGVAVTVYVTAVAAAEVLPSCVQWRRRCVRGRTTALSRRGFMDEFSIL